MQAYQDPHYFDAEKQHVMEFQEVYYFFYGTLMDPETTRRVLKRPDAPELRKATIQGHKLKLWGQYPALVNGMPKQTIHGLACLIKSQEEADRLAAYRTHMFSVGGCEITFEDGSTVSGWVFYWNADELLLREGTFDLEAWKSKKQLSAQNK